jgi:hypothetical protein
MKYILPFIFAALSIPVLGQNIRRCLSKEAVDYNQSLNAGYADAVEAAFGQAGSWSAAHGPKRDILTIPVVFHIVYNEPEENLHDSILFNQIEGLNNDYARHNADTSNMRSAFNPVAGGTQIRFALASVDPNGNPTTGITRTQTDTETFGDLFELMMGSFESLEKVKSTANGGHDAWDQSRYLNIWICDMSLSGMTALLGYATPPADLPNWPEGATEGMGDGVVLQYQVIGSNNPIGIDGYEIRGRTATHEVGHYLGLRHIWGDGSDCTAEDGIDDTPHAVAASEQNCDVMRNGCTDNITGVGDLPDMVENYMDYSAETCQNSFTKGQAQLMHGVLATQRYDLVHNNAALGITENTVTISCYPNPAGRSTTITSSEALKSISVYDTKGALISKQEAGGFSAEVALDGLRNGIYLIVATSQNGVSGQQRVTVAQ